MPQFSFSSPRPRSRLILLVLVAVMLRGAPPAGFTQSVSPSPAPAASPSPSPSLPAVTKEAALRAIESFLANPNGEGSRNAVAVFTRFGQESKEVVIQITPEVAPWIGANTDPQVAVRHRLLAAYIAGNMRSQLQRGVAQDDPLAGWLQTIETYKLLQAANKDLKLTEIESLISEQRAGVLQSRAKNLAKPDDK